MIAPYRLVMPGIVSIYWLLRAGGEHNTQTHTDTRARLIKENKKFKIFFFCLYPSELCRFPSCNFSLTVTNTIWRRRRRRSTLIIMVIKLVDNTHTRTPLRQRVILFFLFFFCFLFFCRARDSVLPLRSCIHYLSPCAADTLFLTNA